MWLRSENMLHLLFDSLCWKCVLWCYFLYIWCFRLNGTKWIRQSMLTDVIYCEQRFWLRKVGVWVDKVIHTTYLCDLPPLKHWTPSLADLTWLETLWTYCHIWLLRKLSVPVWLHQGNTHLKLALVLSHKLYPTYLW